MTTTHAGAQVFLKNILFLTDFSQASEAALPFAVSLARGYGAKVHALHVFIPSPYVCTAPEVTASSIEADEETTRLEMQRVDAELEALTHETVIERGVAVWPAVQRAAEDQEIDLIVLGTHGRTGVEKLLMGSVAEEIFRRSHVPVLTIGPNVRSGAHNAGRFHRVLFATDFTSASAAAAPFAISIARENQAALLLLHVIRELPRENKDQRSRVELSVAEAIHHLYETVPDNVQLERPAEVSVEYGEPAEKILEAAADRGADLIVLGVRDRRGHLGPATHLGRATAHQVVAHATCPVLTVRQAEA